MALAAAAGALVSLQVLVLVRSAFTAFMVPAETAALRHTVEPPELLQANAIVSGTWSVTFVAGSPCSRRIRPRRSCEAGAASVGGIVRSTLASGPARATSEEATAAPPSSRISTRRLMTSTPGSDAYRIVYRPSASVVSSPSRIPPASETCDARTTTRLAGKLVASVLTVIPAATIVFLVSERLGGDDAVHAARREGLFRRLDTPIDVARELADTPDPTAEVFRFLSRCTAAVGLASLVFVITAPAEERGTVIAYSAVTLLLAASLALIRGSRRGGATVPEPA